MAMTTEHDLAGKAFSAVALSFRCMYLDIELKFTSRITFLDM